MLASLTLSSNFTLPGLKILEKTFTNNYHQDFKKPTKSHNTSAIWQYAAINSSNNHLLAAGGGGGGGGGRRGGKSLFYEREKRLLFLGEKNCNQADC